jgi:hypothetical protein
LQGLGEALVSDGGPGNLLDVGTPGLDGLFFIDRQGLVVDLLGVVVV